ncbi:MAG TPA: DUF4350 domain-containing protein [Thermoanaerobaculia bacterium]|nr:DUF4350 domain-containing protein [Thermoanaerobaculia bacterium]
MSRRATLLVVAAITAYVFATLAWVAGDRRAEREAFENPGSTLDRTNKGTSLARALLAERAGAGGRVEALLRRVDPDELPADAVVFRLAPPVTPFLGRWENGEGKDGKPDPKKPPEEPEGKPNGGKKEQPKADKNAEAKKDDGRGKDAKSGKGDKGKEDGEDGEENEWVTPDPLLTDGEEAWVQAGGRLVLAVGEGYGPLDVSGLPANTRVAKAFPLWPGVHRIAPNPPRALAGPPLALGSTVFLAGEQPLVARLILGRGEVILLGCPEIFANDRLAKGDHLALLEALAGPPGARPVYFDERAHGLERTTGTLALLAGWGFGPALLLALLAAGAAFWRARSPLGPPERDDPDLRSDAVDLVDALGELYDRALRRVDALRVHYDNLVRTVAAETGLSGSALAGRMALLLPGFSPPPFGAPEISREELSRQLRTVNEAFGRIDVREHRRKRRT